MFGILAIKRISSFMLENGYIISVQEAGIEGFQDVLSTPVYDLAYHTRVKEAENRSECCLA